MHQEKAMYKRITLIIVSLIIVLMATATFIASTKGANFAYDTIYGTWWFVLLWIVLAILGTFVLVKNKLWKRLSVFLFHASFLLILLGALITHLTSVSGKVHIRKGDVVEMFQSDSLNELSFGFNLTLKEFDIKFYPGTDAPMDYVSTILIDKEEELTISMNNIGEYRGYRFVQSGYDSDMEGVTLGVSRDMAGIGVTYIGYFLLFLSAVLVLCSKKTCMRGYYRKAISCAFLIIFATPLNASSSKPFVIDPSLSKDFGQICVLYKGRICPINTVAIDFVTKLSGKSSWNGIDATDIFASWAFNLTQWEKAKLILIKDKEAQHALGIDGKWASFDDFWDEYNTYKLELPIQEAVRNGDKEKLNHLRDADEKFNLIRMYYGGEFLKVFPYLNDENVIKWLAPGQRAVDATLSNEEWYFTRKSMDYLAESVVKGNNAEAAQIINKIQDFQRLNAKEIVPSKAIIKVEIAYNKICLMKWPVIVFLTISLLVVIFSHYSLRSLKKGIYILSTILHIVMLIYAIFLFSLRWIISQHIPLSNGYETMHFLAMAVLLVAVFMLGRLYFLRNLCLLLASFAMLVATIGGGNPQITPLMPVLQSPLLSIHVMFIMFSYALFALMALISIEGLVMHFLKNEVRETSLAALSQVLLYPAVLLLACGIFVGAIWANVSWGRYWGWDNKEVWALITMLVYALPLHNNIRWFEKPLNLHIYKLIALCSVLMTYFGVNYFLGGLHSYA